MEQYYNHLTDQLENLESWMPKTLPRTKEEYLKREVERHGTCKENPMNAERPMTYKEAFNRENPLIKVARDYLNEHPEEVIKLRDEKLVQELVDFAAKQNAEEPPLAYNNAPTEEEAYLEKRKREGNPLIIFEEVGDWKDVDKLKGSDYDIDKAIDNAKTPIEPSRYMMGTDPYGDEFTKIHISKRNEDGTVEYLKAPEDIIEDDEEDIIEFNAEKISKGIITGLIVGLIIVAIWLSLV